MKSFFSTENISPDANVLHAQKQQSNKIQMSHFYSMIFYYSFCIYKSFSILHFSSLKCFYARCNLRLAIAYVYSGGEVSSVTVDMIAVCCHEHDQT